MIPDIDRQQAQRALAVLSTLSYRTGELKTYLQEVAQGVTELLSLDWTVVTLCQGGSERILASSLDLGEAQDSVYDLHGTLTGTVFKQGCSLVVEDARIDTEYGEAPAGYVAYLGVPLRTPEGKVIGTICSFHRQPRQFNPEEVQLTEIFAERAATAIDNYQLYQHQHQLNTQLQAEIEERVLIESALRVSEERFRKIFEHSNDAILVLDPVHDRILEASPRATQLLEYSRAELIASVSISRLQASQSPAGVDLLQGCQSVLANAQSWTDELICCTRLGDPLPTEISASGVEFGGRTCVMVLIRDISERKKAAAAMARLAEIGELAAMIVHEVRNPLSTVTMALQALTQIDLPERSTIHLQLGVEEADRLQRLLNEILLYAKPQSLQQTPLELNTFCAELADHLQTLPCATDRMIRFDPWPEPIWIRGDTDKLKQVFINLVENACEAIAAGDQVTWQIQSHPSSPNTVSVQIHNGGQPIPPEILPQLTKPFLTTKSSGNGLGLAIVKRMIEAHQGSLQIESTAEAGTTVSVRLPLQSPNSESEIEES